MPLSKIKRSVNTLIYIKQCVGGQIEVHLKNTGGLI